MTQEETYEKIRQAFVQERAEAEKAAGNGRDRSASAPARVPGERGLRRKDPVPGGLSPRVFQALEQSTEREALGMIKSLSKKEAQEKLQAQLDLHRGLEAVRVKNTLEDLRAQCLVEALDHVKELCAERPEIEANIWESLTSKDQFFAQVARLVPVGFLRRYYDLGQDHIRERDP